MRILESTSTPLRDDSSPLPNPSAPSIPDAIAQPPTLATNLLLDRHSPPPASPKNGRRNG